MTIFALGRRILEINSRFNISCVHIKINKRRNGGDTLSFLSKYKLIFQL